MCRGCWIDYGSPQIDTPKVRELAAAASLASDAGENFGFLHCFLEDWNIEDDFLTYDPAISKGGTEAGLRFAEMALAATLDERAAALALAEGYWR